MVKRTIFIFSIFMICINVSAQNKKNEDKKVILKLEHDWLKAEFALDTAFLSSIMDPTYISISREGGHNKKEDLLGM